MKKSPLVVRIIITVLAVGLAIALLVTLTERTGSALFNLENASISSLTINATTNKRYALLGTENGVVNPGIYFSENQGHSWQYAGPGPEATVTALYADSTHNTLFAGTTGGLDLEAGSVWYSLDDGHGWQQYGLTLPTSPAHNLPAVRTMAVNPNNPNWLYVGTWGQGLYRFDLAGTGYERYTNANFDDLYIKQIIPDAKDGFYLLTTDSGLLYLTDEGWHTFDKLPGHALSLAVDPQNANALYVGTMALGLYRSNDKGVSWEKINFEPAETSGLITRITAVGLNAENTQHLAVATAYDIGSQTAAGNIYESIDAGLTWRLVAKAEHVVNSLTVQTGDINAVSDHGSVHYNTALTPETPWSLGDLIRQIPTFISGDRL